MSMYQQSILSVVILGALFFVSLNFNRYIDTRGDMYDGETSVWVICGTGYTIAGFAIVVMLWWHDLQGIMQPWRAGASIAGLLFVCFAASGIPMAIGDAVRAHNRRKERGR